MEMSYVTSCRNLRQREPRPHDQPDPARRAPTGALPQPRTGAARLQPPRPGPGRGRRACRCSSGCASCASSPATSTSSSRSASPASRSRSSSARHARRHRRPVAAATSSAASARKRTRWSPNSTPCSTTSSCPRWPPRASASCGASTWTPQQREWIRDYFFREVMPVLTPIGLDPSHPFPRVLNKSLNFAVELEGKDAFGRSSRRRHRAGAARPAARHPAAQGTDRHRLRLRLPLLDPARAMSANCSPA